MLAYHQPSSGWNSYVHDTSYNSYEYEHQTKSAGGWSTYEVSSTKAETSSGWTTYEVEEQPAVEDVVDRMLARAKMFQKELSKKRKSKRYGSMFYGSEISSHAPRSRIKTGLDFLKQEPNATPEMREIMKKSLTSGDVWLKPTPKKLSAQAKEFVPGARPMSPIATGLELPPLFLDSSELDLQLKCNKAAKTSKAIHRPELKSPVSCSSSSRNCSPRSNYSMASTVQSGNQSTVSTPSNYSIPYSSTPKSVHSVGTSSTYSGASTYASSQYSNYGSRNYHNEYYNEYNNSREYRPKFNRKDHYDRYRNCRSQQGMGYRTQPYTPDYVQASVFNECYDYSRNRINRDNTMFLQY